MLLTKCVDTILVGGDFFSGVLVSMLALSVIDRGFEPRSGQTKD
jgi:hypothetical protein